MSCKVSRDGKEIPVKNLGWLLRHWKEVVDLEVMDDYNGDATLVANLGEDDWYLADFASRSVLHDWLNRPVFKGVLVTWFGIKCKVGDEVYKKLT